MNAIFVPTSNAGKLREFMHAFSAQNRSCLGLKSLGELLKDQFTWTTPVEDRQTFVGNGYRKLDAALPLLSRLSEHCVSAVLVDDSGLCLPRLNYSPGVHSATLAGEPRDDAKNRKFLVDLLREKLKITNDQKEPAFFVCSLLMATPIEQSKITRDQVFVNAETVLSYLEDLEPNILARLEKRMGSVCSAAYGNRLFLSVKETHYQIDLVMGFCTGFVATQEQELLVGEGHGYDALFFPKAKPEFSFASIPLAEKNKMSHRSEALRGLNEWVKSHTVPSGIQELF